MARPQEGKSVRAQDLMQKGIASVGPELSLREFEEFLTAEGISGAPVVGDDGRLVGIASKTDIVRELSERFDATELEAELRVEDVMSREVVCVTPETPASELARIMLDGQLHRVIVARGEQIVGIVTPFDLLRLLV
jgi:CBS domain-containing protein